MFFYLLQKIIPKLTLTSENFSYKRQGRKRPLDTTERKIERERQWWRKHTAPLIPRKISWTAKWSINNAHSDDGNKKKYDTEREREREEKKREREEREKEREIERENMYIVY